MKSYREILTKSDVLLLIWSRQVPRLEAASKHKILMPIASASCLLPRPQKTASASPQS